MSRWNLAWLICVPLLVMSGLALAYTAPVQHRDENYRLVRQLVDVLAEVDQNYVRELTPEEKQKLVEDMINGGLSRLDPYSGYFNSEQFERFMTETDGNFGGIGVQIVWDNQFQALRVLSPMVGTPAYEAGMLAGDLILEVEGEPIRDMTQNEAVRQIMGEPGTEVTLTVLHETAEEPVEITMERAIIQIESVMGYRHDPDAPGEWDYFVDRPSGIAYVRLDGFSETTAPDLKAAIETFQRQGGRGLILDLRNNPGGLLSSAIAVSDLFLEGGEIVSIKNRHGRDRGNPASGRGTMLLPAESHPIAVLINRNSASAAEIVSAALQDHGRAVILGERSYGKGSVQKVLELDHGGEKAALKLTTDSYWRPSGKNIHRYPDSKESDEWGVSPDEGLSFELTPEERLQFLLDQRKREAVQGKAAALPKLPKEAKEELEEEKPFEDRVLKKAIEVLKGKLKEVGAAPPVKLRA